MIFTDLQCKVIYVFSINDSAHRDCLKVGDTLIKDVPDITQLLEKNTTLLRTAAEKRIADYTRTAGIKTKLLWAESTLCIYNGRLASFRDHDVHDVLRRSGIEKKTFEDVKGKPNEWYKTTDVEVIKRAIVAAKEGRKSLLPGEVMDRPEPIQFREEQEKAIYDTVSHFKRHNSMLWYAKMRFGKTLSALQVIKEMGCTRTLILTHRPVVDAGWFEDFGKIFYDSPEYQYGSRTKGESFLDMEKRADSSHKYIYFASLQDLRGSEVVGGLFDKNTEIYATDWELIIVDEAHEGTQTERGKNVLNQLIKKNTRVLHLSGTPFNLLETGEYNQGDIFTWDYVMEQKAKQKWAEDHPGDPNPYEALPTLNIMTYDLGRLMSQFNTDEEDYAFNFREFFRVNDNGKFKHERDVLNFLNLLTKEDKDSYYPFANETYRNIFRHTFWMLPGTKEAKALSELLRQHPIFSNFEIVNVAGDGDDYDEGDFEEKNKEALQKVLGAIGPHPEDTYTITLSCKRLDTGVTVPAWTGVFMLKGEHATQAASYMQTIFRVQSPATIGGRIKTDAYVFDFAPDRTLTVLANVAKVHTKAGKTTEGERNQLGEFLNFCPVIAMEGSQMKKLNVNKMLSQLKRVYVERVVRNGFEDASLYNDELLKLDNLDLKNFEELKQIIGETKAIQKVKTVDINNQGLTNEQYEELEDLEKKNKKRNTELTEEEKARLEELRKVKSQRDTAISILRGISIRMPLMLYGADVKNEDTELTIDNFVNLVDDSSWEEFMPQKVTKEIFAKFMRYYDADIFTAAAKRIREMARAADALPIEERIERLADIFSTFRNPDKEIVLTPWRVVNMHMGETLGGYNFFQSGYQEVVDDYDTPRYIGTEATAEVFNPQTRLLEINSKTGLYPLYLTYSVYRKRKLELDDNITTVSEQLTLWDLCLSENIFVVCKTPMAKAITKRTLCGFRKVKVHMHAYDDLNNQIKNKQKEFTERIKQGSYWGLPKIKDMKFNAVVGNPPYQEIVAKKDTENGQKRSINIFQYFQIISEQIGSYTSLIYPGARWIHRSGKGLEQFGLAQINDPHLAMLKFFPNSTDVFQEVGIADGLSIVMKDNQKTAQGFKYIYSQNGEDTTVEVNNPGEELLPLNPLDIDIVSH